MTNGFLSYRDGIKESYHSKMDKSNFDPLARQTVQQNTTTVRKQCSLFDSDYRYSSWL